MSSAYFFFVAEPSAISSAPKTMSRGTFFSRASTSTSMISSRLPTAMPVGALFASAFFAAALVATIPSYFLQRRYQLCPIDIVECQRHCLSFLPLLSVQFHAHTARLGASEDSHELAPPGRVRRAHPQLRLLPGEAGKIRR